MSFIAFEDVSKCYPGSDRPAVDRVSFEIRQGEFLTLLGPSGSGKTTSLMMLAGFESVSSGAIRLEGQPIERLPAHLRHMGVVFQSYSLFPHLTVAQNVAFPLTVRRRPAAETAERVARALDRVHLRDFAQRRPNQLSGGQQQRVALARALVFEPRLVLMDEPLAALDKRLREELQLEIRRLHREVGVTMVFVTHDQSEAMTLSDRVAVFNHGRIEQLDVPSALYDAPANPFVAGFLGDNNRVEGTLAARDGAVAQVLLAGQAAPVAARASAALQARAGAREVTLCVRPERLRLLNEGEPGGVVASVVDLIHQGDHWRMIVRLDQAPGVAPWHVKLAPGGVPAGTAPGQRVRLGFAPDHAWAY
ncbi:MAG TPA: ABC transporter ATP-binding protein [Burkholderiaceae bacterium]|nr:ABC transporter ATP-binding protein [Burkholderiaceae bacterium]